MFLFCPIETTWLDEMKPITQSNSLSQKKYAVDETIGTRSEAPSEPNTAAAQNFPIARCGETGRKRARRASSLVRKSAHCAVVPTTTRQRETSAERTTHAHVSSSADDATRTERASPTNDPSAAQTGSNRRRVSDVPTFQSSNDWGN